MKVVVVRQPPKHRQNTRAQLSSHFTHSSLLPCIIITMLCLARSGPATRFAPASVKALRATPAVRASSQYSHRPTQTRQASTRRYTKDHEWISVNGSEGTVGISTFAQNALGDVVYVELPEVGASFKKKDVIASVESVKVSFSALQLACMSLTIQTGSQ